MRWLTYFILAYLAMGLQIGLAGVLRYHNGEINFVLIAVVFIALNAPRDSALLGSFVLGALQDMATQQPLGVHALAYGFTAMLISFTQGRVYRGHPLTHFALTLAGGFITAGVMFVHSAVRGPSAPVSIASAFYTAILAPLVLMGLMRVRFLFSFQSGRRKARM